MVDVIVPVYRPEEDKLNVLIERLNHQTISPEHVFFMQTLTRDKKTDQHIQDILKKANHSVITTLPKNEFDHGGTRNRGAAMSEAEFILFMTQDAMPTDDILIATLLQAMERAQVAVAYARQLPGSDVGVVESYTREFNYPSKSSRKSKKDLKRLGIKTYFCSNVCAMYRKSAYEEMGGFVLQTIFNEDMIMASKLIQAGYEIAYAAQAQVIHAHKYTYRQQFTRNFDMAVSQRQYREIFETVKSETEGIRLVKQTIRYLNKQGKWYLVPDLVLQSGFKFLGYRFGKKYDILPLWLVRKMSMNKSYWKDGKPHAKG